MDDPETDTPDIDEIAVPDRPVGRGGLLRAEHPKHGRRRGDEHVGVILVDDDCGACLLFHVRVAAGVIHMAVGVDDIADPDLVFLCRLDEAARLFRRIDHERLAAFLIAHHVGENRHLSDLPLLDEHDPSRLQGIGEAPPPPYPSHFVSDERGTAIIFSRLKSIRFAPAQPDPGERRNCAGHRRKSKPRGRARFLPPAIRQF